MFLLFVLKVGVGMFLALVGCGMLTRQLQNAQKRIDDSQKK